MSETSRPPKTAGKSSSRPAASRSAAPQAPPRVVKKKKPVKRESSGESRPARPSDPPSELIVPLILVGVGLVATTATTFMLRPESIPLGVWVAIRMTIVIVSAVLTYGALFVAAQVLDIEYGYISTGAVKVAAITFTQDWVGDAVSQIPIPFLPWLLTAATTYGMFMYFFDIDLNGALASVFVVRLVHFLAFALLFVAIVSGLAGGGGGALDLMAPPGPAAPADPIDPADVNHAAEEPDLDEPIDMNQ
jgi:hypothetical protein